MIDMDKDEIKDVFADIVESYGDMAEQLTNAEYERGELIELLFEIRCYCQCHSPENLAKDILSYIEEVRQRLDYDHPDWEIDYTRNDEDGD